jgi:hypothetical protein
MSFRVLLSIGIVVNRSSGAFSSIIERNRTIGIPYASERFVHNAKLGVENDRQRPTRIKNRSAPSRTDTTRLDTLDSQPDSVVSANIIRNPRIGIMPRLKKYMDRPGYYVRGSLADHGCCTWQIAEAGLHHLRQRGVSPTDHDITPAVLRELKDRGWIWTRGSGTTGDATPDRRKWDALAKSICAWSATDGTPEKLLKVLTNGGDHRGALFDRTFLTSLATIPGLSEIAPADFDEAAEDAFDFNDHSLHALVQHLSPGWRTFWRLGRIVGCVTQYEQCPPAWRGTLLWGWLWEQWGSLDRKSIRTAVAPRLAAPEIWWDVEGQQVVARTPRMRRPHPVHEARWRWGSGEPQSLRIIPDREAATVEPGEEVLTPGGDWGGMMLIRGESTEVLEFEFDTLGASDLLLFHAHGLLANRSRPLAAGDYLILQRGPATPKGRGLTILQEIATLPAGWPAVWHGWSVRLRAGAVLGDWAVSSSAPIECHFAKEADGRPWHSTCPVYTDGWPALAFAAATAALVVEIVVTDMRERIVQRSIQPLQLQGDETTVTLPVADTVFGTCRIQITDLERPDATPRRLGLLRIPSFPTEVIPDPQDPQGAAGVRVGTDVVPAADTLSIETEAGAVLVARDSVRDPSIGFGDRDEAWAVRLRVGVARARFPATDNSWRPLPIGPIDASAIKLDDTLEIEFISPPPTEGKGLVCSRVGGEAMVCGAVADPRFPRRFRIALHEWRDRLGDGEGNQVLVRAASGWMPVTVWHDAKQPDAPRPQPMVGPHWFAERDAIEQRLMEARYGEAADLLTDAVSNLNRLPKIRQEVLAVALSRLYFALPQGVARPDSATRLAERLLVINDGEAAELARRMNPSPADRRPVARVYRKLGDAEEAFIAALKDTGPWWSCGECARDAAASSVKFARSDAAVIGTVAAMMDHSVSAPSTEEVYPHHRNWIQAIRFCTTFVRTIWTPSATLPAFDLNAVPRVLSEGIADFVLGVLDLAVGRIAPTWKANLPSWGNCTAQTLLNARLSRMSGDPTAAEQHYGDAVRQFAKMSFQEVVWNEWNSWKTTRGSGR